MHKYGALVRRAKRQVPALEDENRATRVQWGQCKRNQCECRCRCHSRTCYVDNPGPFHSRRGYQT